MGIKTELKLFRRGKVRDVYDLGDKLLLVATDRLSAFDCILPTPIPDKGKLLTEISAFWFKKGWVESHFITADFAAMADLGLDRAAFEGRTTLARKAERLDVECVVRGYLAGSAWKEYRSSGAVCGHKLPPGLAQAQKLPEPIFTPATKNDSGHDENITRERLAELAGAETARELERLSLLIYRKACEHLEPRGLILADTKFEFGRLGGRLILIDELLTPDSSRLWDAGAFRPGTSPESFDKQFVRDYLEKIAWDKNPPAPALPPEVAEGTARRYREALRKITQ